jgi:uncharacterized membrane protein YsdA (DUF1294 family)
VMDQESELVLTEPDQEAAEAEKTRVATVRMAIIALIYGATGNFEVLHGV